jgi:hypothetical protein
MITINHVKINSINAIQHSQEKTQGTQVTLKDRQKCSEESETYSDKRDSSSGHDSIIYTRDQKHNSVISNVLNTIESCTSSEFRAGLNIMDESSFISKGNQDVNNLNIDIKESIV